MTATFKQVRRLQGERVRMKFDDDREVVAQLLCATRDMDGSKHLLYDKVESAQGAESGAAHTGCLYADGRTLLHIEHADAKNLASGPRGRDNFTMRSQFEKNPPKAPRPTA